VTEAPTLGKEPDPDVMTDAITTIEGSNSLADLAARIKAENDAVSITL